MVVENRKLFSNRDARRRLSEMGGIMASSPELLGEAQLFADGGTVREVPGYLDSGAGEKNYDLIRAINSSAKGAEFADFLNRTGQQGMDIVSAAFRQTAGAGLEIDAALGMAMSQAAAFLGFPEKAAEWSANAQNELAYSRNMQAGNIDVLGRPRGDAAYTVPDAALRMKDAARVQDIIDREGPNSSLLAEGAPVERLNDIPPSIIQARITPAPAGLMGLPQALGAAPMEDPSMLGVPSPEMPAPRASAPGQLPMVDVSTGTPLTADEISAQLMQDRLSIAGDNMLHSSQTRPDSFPSEDQRRAEQDAELELIRARMLADSERAQMAGYEETAAANAAGDAMYAEAKRSADEAAAAREAAGITDARGSMGAAIAEGRPEDAAAIAEAARGATDTPAAENVPGVDIAAVEEAAATGGAAGASTAVLGGLGIDTSNMTAADRVSTYQKMFKEILGGDTDDDKEVWMNMAMIGFAIASGESPNALQNIAQGLLAGTKQMREDKATKQAREDKINMLALEQGMLDVRDQEKFGRDLQLARIRASNTGTQEPYADAVRVLAQAGLTNGIYSNLDEAIAAAEAALRPLYGMDAGGGGASTPTVTADPSNPQQLEAAAKARGETEFVYNGQRYPVR